MKITFLLTFKLAIILILLYACETDAKFGQKCSKTKDCSSSKGEFCFTRKWKWGRRSFKYCKCRYGFWNSDHNSCIASIRNAETGLCLSTHGYLDGSLRTENCNDADYEKWAIIRSGPLFNKIMNMNSKKCLSNRSNSTIRIEDCNKKVDKAQQWKIVSTSIINKLTGYFLDSNIQQETNTGQVYSLRSNGGNFQNWIIY